MEKETPQTDDKAAPPNPAGKPDAAGAPPPGAAEKPGAAPAAAAPAAAKPVPKPAAKPAAKAAKPPPKPKDPLIDNGDGTITDPNTGLIWKKDDAWLDRRKFYPFAQHKEYLEELNKEKFAGYDDWRLPTKVEAASLVDKKKENIDKNGTKFPLDPVFSAGRVCNTWISECTEEKVLRFDFKIGGDMAYPPAEIWASIYAVRKPAPAKQDDAADTPADAAPAVTPPAATPETPPSKAAAG